MTRLRGRWLAVWLASPRRQRGPLAILLGLGLLVGGCAAASDPAQPAVRVAAASDLQYAFDEVVASFQQTHPQIRVEVSYGSSGLLYQQLTNGAPYDLYLAADIGYAQRLVDEALADPADRFGYAQGRLVLWAGDGSPLDPRDGLAVVREANRVAIANPAHAPYGQAAAAALRSAGLYDEVAGRLVLGDSVAQAAEFVVAGNAEVGIVAMAQVLAPPLREVGEWQEVPQELFPPLAQGGVVLAGASDLAAARALRDHLISPTGQAVLRRYGFGPPAG